MTEIVISDMQTGLPAVIKEIAEYGALVAPRGVATVELMNASVILLAPEECLATGIGRKLNRGVAAVEALQLIGGVSHPELMGRIAPNTLQFRDGGAFNGAYGPRIGMQLPLVVERLKRDPSTRQAIITIWDPLHDLVRETSNDYPCTLSFQFLMRDGHLSMITNMRSNDVWWGFTYDVVQFTQLQLTVANALGVMPGPYYHNAGSLHLYERDIEKAMKLTSRETAAPPLRGLGYVGMDIKETMARARGILDGTFTDGGTETEQWMKLAIA